MIINQLTNYLCEPCQRSGRCSWRGLFLLPGVVPVVRSRWYRSRRKERFNKGWPRVRRMILARDGHSCQWPVTDDFGVTRPCGAAANEVDHRRRAENGMPDDDSPSNLWALCSYHHKIKTQCESAEQRRVNRRRREDAAWYSHPAFRSA